MGILLALSKTEVRERVAFAIGSRYPVKPLEAGSAREAIEQLANHPATALVICEYPGISDVLFRHLVSVNRKRPDSPIRCVACSNVKPDDEDVKALSLLGHVPWSNLIDGVFAHLDPILLPDLKTQAQSAQEAPESYKDLSDPDFCQIKTTLLIRVGPLKADIFLRLSSKKYVKLFQEGDSFEEEDYRRFLIGKKTEHLHLRRDECSEFLTKFKADLLLLLQAEVFTTEINPILLGAVHETVQELFTKLGPTKEVQEVVKANIQLTIKSMSKSTRLSDILNRIEVEKGKYISSHSVLLPQIACSLASGMEWKSDLTYQKLTLAAFLHDMPLTNHKLAAISSLTELSRRKEQFTEEEAKAYRNHPMRAAELAKQFHEVPPDVDTIVAQHHEQPDGSGFPRGLTHPHISPLGAVFIVAHDIVGRIFEKNGDFITEEFVDSVKDRYVGSSFKKLLKVLTEMKIDSADQ